MTGPFTLKKQKWKFVEVTKAPANLLGKGAFGVVYQGKRRGYEGRGGKGGWPEGPIAVKFPHRPLADQREMNSFIREVSVMAEIEHPACLSMFAWTLNPATREYGIATDLMPNSLEWMIEKDVKGLAPPEWTPTRRACVAYAIAAGMAYLESKNIIHRDLKPENVLLDEQMLPHIADYGLSRFVTVENQMEMTREIGTPLYMAPELIGDESGTPYDWKVDVYAFGLLLFAMFTSRKPFDEYMKGYKGHNPAFYLMNLIQKGTRPTLPPDLPDKVAEMIQACWDSAPDNRPTFAEILEHPEGFLLDDVEEDAFEDFRKDLLDEKKMDLPL
jgi:serine/threonine protein kinase